METVAIDEREEATWPRAWLGSFTAALVAMMVLQTASLGFSPLLPALQAEFRMSFSQLGLFTGAYGLLAIALSVPSGLAVRRFGSKPMMCAGMAVVFAGLIMVAVAGSFAAAFAGRALWLTGYRLAFVAVLAALATTCPPGLRGRSMGVLGAIACVASVLGAPFGSLLSVHFDWRGGLVGFAALAIVGLVVVAIAFRPQTLPDAQPSESQPRVCEEESSAGSAFLAPRVWGVALFSGLVGMPAFGATFFAPSAARMNFHIEAISTAWIISLGYLLGMVVNLLVGVLVDHFNKWAVLTVLIACVVPCALLMNSSNLAVFRLATATVIALSFTGVNQSYGLASDVVRGSQVGNVMGVVSLGAGLTGYVGPQLLGILRDRTHTFRAGWIMLAVIAAATCVDVALLGIMSARSATGKRQ